MSCQKKWWMSGRSQTHSAGESPVFPWWDSLFRRPPSLLKLAAMEKEPWGKNQGEWPYLWPTYDLLMTYLWHLMIYLWPTFIIFSIVIFQHHLPRRSSLWIPLGGSYQARAAQPMSQPWSTWVNLGAPQNPPHFWASSAEHWPTGDGSKPWYPCSSHQNGW